MSVSTKFTFSQGEGNVGEPLHSQIEITSTARQGSAPITLSTLTFQFKGCLSEIQLSHEIDESVASSDSRMSELSLEETSITPPKPRWTGSSDLTIYPGQTRVYSFPIIFREAGDIETVASIFEINTDHFDLICTTPYDDLEPAERPTWWLQSGSKIRPRKLNRESGTVVKVLPKPPKMEIRLPDVRDQYYTDEQVTLAIEVLNKEEEDTEAVLEIRLLGRSKDTLGFSWLGRDASSPMKEVPPPLDGSEVDLPGHVVGRLAQGEKIIEKIRFAAPSEPADYAIEVKVLYHLLSDRDIPISKTLIADLVFNGPFEASYDFTPRLHPEPWPSYFSMEDTSANRKDPENAAAFGIAQKWHLRAKVASFAEDVLIIKDMAIETQGVHGGAVCSIAKEFPEDEVVTMNPQDLNERSFCIDTRKVNLEERRPTALNFALGISWHRADSDEDGVVTSLLPIPRITIPSSEPRVLATATPSTAIEGMIHLDYVLENPTMHFLTFEVNMEASEEFGFSGPKLGNLHLLPMSRQSIRYNILPLVDKGYIWPSLRVVDRYFNQTLKVIGTDGLRSAVSGKKGIGLWIGPESDKGRKSVESERVE